MQIDVPDDAINNFYKANLWHNAITTDRDPEMGLYNHCVATVHYRVFANETVIAARLWICAANILKPNDSWSRCCTIKVASL